jgi:hypothetical protein
VGQRINLSKNPLVAADGFFFIYLKSPGKMKLGSAASSVRGMHPNFFSYLVNPSSLYLKNRRIGKSGCGDMHGSLLVVSISNVAAGFGRSASRLNNVEAAPSGHHVALTEDRDFDENSRHVEKGAHAVLVMDRAGWHTTAKLKMPKNITAIFLPSRAPELNPVENVWQYLRQNWLSNSVFDTYDAIIDAACEAWKKLLTEPQTITSFGMRQWAHVGQTS